MAEVANQGRASDGAKVAEGADARGPITRAVSAVARPRTPRLPGKGPRSAWFDNEKLDPVVAAYLIQFGSTAGLTPDDPPTVAPADETL